MVSKAEEEPPEETVGDRIFLVRAAHGRSVRDPLPQEEFAEKLNALAGRKRYNGPRVSLLERGKRKPTLDDIKTIADSDPQRRGRGWLAFGDWIDQARPTGDWVFVYLK